MAVSGDTGRAAELGKGFGRAIGKALLGGGILKDVPVFHELATLGESLGDLIGGFDTKSAANRWDTYAHQSVIGSGAYAASEFVKGNREHAWELCEGMFKAAGKCFLTVAVVGATVLTGKFVTP